MNVTTTMNNGMATLRCVGELDYTSTASTVDTVRRLLAESPAVTTLHLDCAELTFCDSAGLAGLLDIHQQARTCGVALHLDNRPAQLDRLLDVTGTFDHLVVVAESGVAADESEETELG